MSSHIGIVGVSPEGAALFYRQVARDASRLATPDRQPRISVHNEPLNLYLEALRKQNWEAVGVLLRRSAELLARCGAQFCLTPDNAVQHGVQLAEVGSPIPWITPTELVAGAVAADGRKRVGIIGTMTVMHSSTYQTPLGLKGVEVLPPEQAEAETLEQIIYGELLYGTIRPESRYYLLDVVNHLSRRGCEGVIVALSEAPLIVTQETCPLPLYDASDILAEACVRRAVAAE